MALPGLYLITDGRAADNARRTLDVLEAALRGGVRLVQLREKGLTAKELLSLAADAAGLVHRYGGRLLVNDRADIARLAGADGVHLTSKSYPACEARALLGEGALIGVSTHSVDEAVKAEAEGADFVTFGPVFFTPSKAGMGAPVGAARLREAVESLRIPVFGLGGINETNMNEVAATKASAAVISAIMASAEPEEAAKRIILEMTDKGTGE